MSKVKLTPEQEKRKCGGCWYLGDIKPCAYPYNLEFGKYGKCLKKRKA